MKNSLVEDFYPKAIKTDIPSKSEIATAIDELKTVKHLALMVLLQNA